MSELDLFAGYPEPKEPRIVGPNLRTIHNRIAASSRGLEFYDGDRANGYGGMKDDGRWAPIAKNLVSTYNLAHAKVLQIGAHKGFLLGELCKLGCNVYGTEISDYAIKHSKIHLVKAPFTKLPYKDGLFNFVIGASCVYTLNLPDAILCLREIQRVSNGNAWITLAAYETPEDLMLLRYWMLLGTSILSKSDWLAVMEHAGYTGDYRFDTAQSLNLRLA